MTSKCKRCGAHPEISYATDGSSVSMRCTNDDHFIDILGDTEAEARANWEMVMSDTPVN